MVLVTSSLLRRSYKHLRKSEVDESAGNGRLILTIKYYLEVVLQGLAHPTTARFQWRPLKNDPYTYTVNYEKW